ncbi:MAG: GntR family transcriptional regulator [Campylobacterales bacterium]
MQLEKGGYIVHKKNVGGVVKKITAEGVEEILHVVGVLEGNAVELAAMKPLKKKEIAHLIKLQKQMIQLAGARNYSKYIEVNEKFHKYFVDECGNTTLKTIVDDLRNRAYSIRALGFTLPLHIDEYITSHDAIIKAIVENDPIEAGRIMKDHVFQSKKLRAIALRDNAYA